MNLSSIVDVELNASLASPVEKEDLSPLGYSIAAVFLFFIMVFGVLNNLCVIVTVAGTPKLRTPMNCILLNLSVSDFTISLVGTPMSFASAVSGRWVFGEFLCEGYAFLMTLTGMTAIGTLAAIAIDRYFIISRSFHGQNHVPSSLVIGLIWLYSLAQAVPPLLGWNRYVLEHPGIACSLDWQTPDATHSTFIIYIFVLGYVMPVAILSFCYVRVVCIIKHSPKPSGNSCTAKAEHKVTLMACAMIACTLVAWTPYAVVSLMVSLGYDHLLGPVASVCPAIFAKTSVIYNPIVYFFFNTQIRETIISKIPGFCKRRHDSGTEISMETKRGLTIVNNTVISNHMLGYGVECATTQNL